MLRNRRRKIPYLSAGIIFLCIMALAFLEIRGLRIPEATPYIAMAWLYDSKEDSLQDYEGTEKLPLCYQFNDTGYQVDIPNIHFQSTGGGIASEVSDALWLYIAEYDKKERGISMVLEELPPIFLGSVYNRNSSYIYIEETQKGYLAGFAVEYTYGEVNLAQAPGQEVAGVITIFDFTVGDKGLCVAAMTTESTKHWKDACRDQAWEIAVTMRPNPDFEMPEKEDSTVCEDMETVDMEYTIEEIVVADLSGEEGSGSSEGTGLKTQYVKPTPTPKPVSTAEPTPMPEPTSPPKSVQAPEPVSVIEQEPEPAPSHETGNILQMMPTDINQQTFNAPLTGVAMSITVTLGFSGNSTVTVLCPDGTVLNPETVDGNIFSFNTTAQPGSYVVMTTGYSAAGSVSVHVHCG